MLRISHLSRLGTRRILAIGLAISLTTATTAIVAAVVASDPGPFTGCLATKTTAKGTLYNVAIGSAPTAICAKGDGQITFSNAQGPIGPQGAQGIAGRDGANGTDGTNGTDGAPGPAGPAGGVTDSYGSYSAANVPILVGQLNTNVVRSTTVPAGSYVIFTTGMAQNLDRDAYFQCYIRAAGTIVAQNNAVTQDGFAHTATISIVAQASLPSGGVIDFICDSAYAGAEVRLGSLVALKVGAIH